MDEAILEPVKSYFEQYRDKHRELAERYFDELVKQSGVSPEENAALMSERDKALAKFNKADAAVRSKKGVRVFVIVLTVLLIVGGLITCLALAGGALQWAGILTVCLCVAIAAALIVVICVVLNKRIKEGASVADKYRKEVADIEKKAWAQMQPLNSKYDWHIPDELIYETVPQIRLDKYFDEDKLAYFTEHCNIGVYDECSSAVSVKSGNSDGKPFMLTRFLRQSMEPFTYTGTRVVTWTRVERDSQGHSHTVTESQTLVATVVRPKPVYRPVTYLFYGCDAAEELHFDRKPTVPADADDKKIDGMVRKGEKELEKKARRAVNNGETFNKLANSEFEVLFGADNRDNEMQFRMMFTPLAQRNMVQLLRSKQPYGDDFYFYKLGAVNVIRSAHGAGLALDANPTTFIHYDLAKARNKFVDFNCDYFRSLYFDFAPLFSIPLYMQHDPAEKFGVCEKLGNIGNWEAESVANYFDPKLLAHPSTATELIVKAQTVVGKDSTTAHITAHSFEAVPQVAIVPVLCRNGRTYEVPVPWILYEPLEQTTDIIMQSLDVTREQFNAENNDGALFVGGIRAQLT